MWCVPSCTIRYRRHGFKTIEHIPRHYHFNSVRAACAPEPCLDQRNSYSHFSVCSNGMMHCSSGKTSSANLVVKVVGGVFLEAAVTVMRTGTPAPPTFASRTSEPRSPPASNVVFINNSTQRRRAVQSTPRPCFKFKSFVASTQCMCKPTPRQIETVTVPLQTHKHTHIDHCL
mgnify:FL=1